MLSRLLLWAGLSLTIGPADVCADQGPRLNHQPSDSPLALPSPEGGQAQLPAALLSPQSRPAASEVLLKGMIRPLSRPKTDGILVAQMSHRGPLGPVGISNRRSSLDPEFETLTHARTTTPSRASSTGTLFAQAIPKEAEAQYKKATELLKKEKNVEAIQVLHQALDLYPDYFLALQALGVVYVREGQFEAALKTLSHAIQVNPKSDVSFLSIGIAQLNLNRMEESIQSLRQSTALNPRSSNGYLILGYALIKSGHAHEAEDPLQLAFRFGGGRVIESQLYLANAYEKTGRFHDAANALQLYLKHAPKGTDKVKIETMIERLQKKSAESDK